MNELSLLGIFVAGLLTFASPCILPLVPIHLSVLAGASVSDLKAGARSRGATWAGLAFALGLVLVFMLLGLAASFAGRLLLEHRVLLLQLGGLAVFLFGLKYLGYLHVPWLEQEARPLMRRLGSESGPLGALVFGAAFGLGWTPCIGPVLGAVLTYAAAEGATPAVGALYLAVYASGIALPLVVTAAIAPLALRWHARLLPYVGRIEKVTGALLAGVGLLLLTDNLSAVIPLAGPALVESAVPAAQAAHGPALAMAELAPTPYGAKDNATCEGAHSGEHTGCGLPDVTPESGLGVETALRPGTARLVEFVSKSCPICQRMEPVLLAAEQRCAGQGLRVHRVDVGTAAGRKLADSHRVRGVPTFLFLDESDGEVARLVGEQPLAMLEQSMQVLSGAACDGYRALP